MSEVEAMIQINLHREVYSTIDTMVRTQEGWFSETLNYVQPGDPLTSPLSNAVWSKINRTVFEGIRNGDASSEIRSNTRDEADDYLSEVMERYIEQLHENFGDIYYHWLIFGEETEGDYLDGEEIGESGEVDLGRDTDGEADNGLDSSAVFFASNSNKGTLSGLTWGTLDPYDVVMPNGELKETYILRNNHHGSLGTGTQWYAFYPNSLMPDLDPQYVEDVPTVYWAEGPDGNSTDDYIRIQDWVDIFTSIEEIREDYASGLPDYVDEMVSLYDAGDIEDVDLLDATDVMNEFGDADGLTRTTAELVSLGYAGADDLTHQVTIETTNDETLQGMLFPSWDFSVLAPAEYRQDGDSLTLTHVHDGAEYTVETADSSETFTYDDVEISGDGLGDDDRHEGTVTLSASDDVTEISVDSEGAIRAYIPTGSTVSSDDYNSAIFARIDSGGYVKSVSLSGEFTLTEVIDENGEELDHFSLRGYNTVSRDPALALDDQRERERNRDDDLDDLSTGAGGGLLEGSSAIGIGAAAALLLAILLGR